MNQGFESGQRVILVEDGSRTTVEIIQNNCDDEREAYRIRVIQLLCNRFDGDNAFTQEDEGSRELDIYQARGFRMWTLETEN